jgi:methyl-accepting chemotaxis protein
MNRITRGLLRLTRFRLRTRIFFGYGLLIALLLGIAAFGSYGLSAVGEEIDIMDGIAGNANRLQELALKMEIIRRGLADYRIDGDANTLHEVTDAETRAVGLLKESADNTLSEQRRAMFHGVAEKLLAFAANRADFASSRDAGQNERARLFTISDTLNAAVDQLSQVAAEDDTLADKASVAEARLAIAAAETAGSRFLASSDPAWVPTFRKTAATAVQALSRIDGSASPRIRSVLPTIVSSWKSYAAAFDQASAAMIAAESLYSQQIRPSLQDMQGVTGKALDRLIAGFKSTSQKAYDSSADTLTKQLGLSAAATLVGIILALLMARSIIRPIKRMTGAMTGLATGDTGTEVPGRNNVDEIGEMARAVEVFRQQAIENGQFAAAQQREQAAKERRQKAMDLHTKDFGISVSGVMESFMVAAATMRQAASDVSEGARQTRVNTSDTVEGATASARDLNAIAAAAEQMAVSIHEISKRVEHVTVSVKLAVDRATDTDIKVAGLSAAADRIGDVVRIITDIAGRTNLLALNATIEAARAGEAGKGFAVVAGEVKALATQTTRATSEIGAQIVAIRSATGEAVAAVRDVGVAIGQVESVATAIAAAVQQQASATREITGSVQLVTVTTSNAAEAMRHVLSIVESTDASGRAALKASDEVNHTADTLRSEVNDFLAAMSHGDEAERRLYERIDAGGAQVTVRADGQPAVEGALLDISRGGAQLTCRCEGRVGNDSEITLPGGDSVRGRIIRNSHGSLGIAFRQDETSLKKIDKAMAFIASTIGRRAA